MQNGSCWDRETMKLKNAEPFWLRCRWIAYSESFCQTSRRFHSPLAMKLDTVSRR